MWFEHRGLKKNKKAGRRSAPYVGADGGLFRLIGAYVAFASFVYHSLVVLVIAFTGPFGYACVTKNEEVSENGNHKNLCAQIPIDLHERVSEERERLGQTTSEYITNLIQDYYNMMENQKGGIQMTEKGRTMAFQIPEELFQRIKRHLERETLRSGKKLTQRDFVLNLITQALDEADAENTAEQNAPTEAPVAPRVADVTAPADTDTPDEGNAV